MSNVHYYKPVLNKDCRSVEHGMEEMKNEFEKNIKMLETIDTDLKLKLSARRKELERERLQRELEERWRAGQTKYREALLQLNNEFKNFCVDIKNELRILREEDYATFERNPSGRLPPVYSKIYQEPKLLQEKELKEDVYRRLQSLAKTPPRLTSINAKSSGHYESIEEIRKRGPQLTSSPYQRYQESRSNIEKFLEAKSTAPHQAAKVNRRYEATVNRVTPPALPRRNFQPVEESKKTRKKSSRGRKKPSKLRQWVANLID